jgi:hypothetical protein
MPVTQRRVDLFAEKMTIKIQYNYNILEGRGSEMMRRFL